jgi:hypothetical protein
MYVIMPALTIARFHEGRDGCIATAGDAAVDLSAEEGVLWCTFDTGTNDFLSVLWVTTGAKPEVWPANKNQRRKENVLMVPVGAFRSSRDAF